MSALSGDGLVLHHVCYAVPDIERAAVRLARALGAGPFFLMPHAPFDELLSEQGQPCSWEHQHAFGRLGSQTIELTHTLFAAPAALASMLSRAPVNHVAYLAPDLQAASDRLLASGARRFLRAKRGEVQMVYHELPGLGCVEILQQAPAHESLAASLARQAAEWDGSRPLRHERPM